MIPLNSLSDENLLTEIKNRVQQEREILTEILHHLKEIDRRRLYSKLKFQSLFEFTTKGLGYSEDQAYRRIQAMRLLKELPEIEEKINEGFLSLTHLGMAQSLFKRGAKSGQKSFTKEEKLEILTRFENTSKREAEKVVTFLTGQPLTPVEQIKAIAADHFEFRFIGDGNLLGKIQKLKGVLAHKKPGLL